MSPYPHPHSLDRCFQCSKNELAIIDASAFSRELRRWSWRGALSAVPSFAWARSGGYDTWDCTLGMLLGISFWVLLFSAACSARGVLGLNARFRLLESLRTSVWVKLASAALGTLLALAESNLPRWAIPFVSILFSDFATGVSVERWARSVLEAPHQFSTALLATIAQGAVISLELMLIAALLLALRPRRQNTPRSDAA